MCGDEGFGLPVGRSRCFIEPLAIALREALGGMDGA